MKTLNYAPDAFRYLNGFFCTYKPAGLVGLQVRQFLLKNLVRGLNEMEVRPPRERILIDGSVASGKPLVVKVVEDYADNTLVVGPRYQIQDIRCIPLNSIGRRTSGIQLFAINDHCQKSKDFKLKKYLQMVEVKGKFGFATDTHFDDGKVWEKATYNHIYQETLDKVLASIQASHQCDVFKYSGVHIESQEAYELASQGIVRPAVKSISVLYNMCCTEFNRPYFTLRIHCINADDIFLAKLVHQIGISLKSCAVCCQIRQLQYGPFTLAHALLQKHWTAEHILNNIILCKNILELESTSTTAHIKPINKTDVDKVIQDMQNEYKMDDMEH